MGFELGERQEGRRGSSGARGRLELPHLFFWVSKTRQAVGRAESSTPRAAPAQPLDLPGLLFHVRQERRNRPPLSFEPQQERIARVFLLDRRGQGGLPRMGSARETLLLALVPAGGPPLRDSRSLPRSARKRRVPAPRVARRKRLRLAPLPQEHPALSRP